MRYLPMKGWEFPPLHVSGNIEAAPIVDFIELSVEIITKNYNCIYNIHV